MTDRDAPLGLSVPVVHALLEIIGMGVVLINSEGRIVRANGEAGRVLGLHGDICDGESWLGSFVRPSSDGGSAAPAEDPVVGALRGETPTNLRMSFQPSGADEPIQVELRAGPVKDIDGKVVGAVATVREVTRPGIDEADLRASIAELEEVQRTRRQLTRFLLHDLKSPLTTILGLAGLELQNADPDSDSSRQLQGIIDAAGRVNRMTLDLLDIQVAQDGELQATIAPLGVTGILELVQHTLGPRASLDGVTLAAATVGPDFRVAADRDLLLRVLLNLVDNCLKFGPKGGRVSVDAVPCRGRAHITVEDEGPGVPDGLRETIFAEYAKREGESETRGPGSHGIGLRFCRVAVEAQAGRIWVEDNEPRGARFVVDLPMA